MRHLQLFAVLAPVILVITGCGPDTGSGGSAFNPATSVTRTFEDFTVNDEGGEPFITRTIFYDFYRGLEAADGEDDRGAAQALRERLNLVMGLTPGADGKTYTAARNPLDLLHHVINTDMVGTFNDGKRLMRDSVTNGTPATYNTPANGAIIRFEDMEGHTGAELGPDQVWVFPLLDWTSNFPRLDPNSAFVFRSAQFIARPAEEGDPNPAEIKSAFWSGRFKGESFSATGYNQPDYFNFNVTGRQFGNLDFYKVLTAPEYDTLFLIETSGITIDGKEPVFICARINYSTSKVTITYEVDPEADTGSTDPDPSQCPDVGTSFSYSSETVDSRQ